MTTWNDIKRSTEEERREFKKLLVNLLLTPDKFNRHINELIKKEKGNIESNEVKRDESI
jgi:hypothetical protein